MRYLSLLLVVACVGCGKSSSSTPGSFNASASSAAQAVAAKPEEPVWHDMSKGPITVGTAVIKLESLKTNVKGAKNFKDGIAETTLLLTLENKGDSAIRIHAFTKPDDVGTMKDVVFTDGKTTQPNQYRFASPLDARDNKHTEKPAFLPLTSGKSAIVQFNFECKSANPKELRLTVPGEHFGQTGTVRLVFPAAVIEVQS